MFVKVAADGNGVSLKRRRAHNFRAFKLVVEGGPGARL